MARERSLEISSHEQMTEAATFNARVFKKLEKALNSNPEVDLLSLFPSNYSTRLTQRKKSVTNNDVPLESSLPKQDKYRLPTFQNDVRYLLSSDDVAIIDQPSDSVLELVKSKMISTNPSQIVETKAQFSTQFSGALIRLIQEGEIVGSVPVPSRRMVVKCGVDTVAKLVWGAEDITEYSTLQYLLEHKPKIPAPRPLGLLRMGRVTIFFISYMSGTTLEAIWRDLAADQKASVRDQLDVNFRDLRTMEFPRGMPLGGVAGEGCKDQRRHLRRSTTPIFDAKEFEAFQFSNPKYGSTIFIDFLREFTARDSPQIVFTHGDLRPANVIVKVTEDNRYIVTGLIDWEDSGFYPESHEATKITNCLATNEDWDWYCFLPPGVSPHTYRVEWLLDYILGRHLE